MLSCILMPLGLLLKSVEEKLQKSTKQIEIQEEKYEYMKIQSQASFYFLGLNIYV